MKANIGIRAHDIEHLPLEQLASVVSRKGLTSVQLALAKSFGSDFETGFGTLSPGYAHHIGNAFRKENIQIAVLGCYINMIHPNDTERIKELDRFKEHIRFARDFGCSIVGTETGNINPENVYTEENFTEGPYQKVVNSVRELVSEAEKHGVIVGIEGGINHPIHTPQRMKRLLEDINSNNLQVIFDPVNYLTVDNYLYQEEVFKEAFELFGERIVILHAKDYIIENNRVKMVPVGTGLLNYKAVFRYIKKNKPFINILLENTREPYINDSIAFMQKEYELV
ncbi:MULTISPECIES: sugar phosphate isomerase/epimerase [unclassified Bacillus (in: firmicutes)]|uniref:sugar phosphate isomerase/epimerase family protein n=2 Tax=Bacillales TaxID=1385 RepID=UPI00080AEB86|nr:MULTISPECIES: sugar phosphate isomerase/epimerase family protein [unclassified Bacillus (in: firmicutes)]OCA89404.1 AP endonuclease [Bacillus sp. FJAT-27986]